jgi:hypothetical protein
VSENCNLEKNIFDIYFRLVNFHQHAGIMINNDLLSSLLLPVLAMYFP